MWRPEEDEDRYGCKTNDRVDTQQTRALIGTVEAGVRGWVG